jgi:hypothetical protein
MHNYIRIIDVGFPVLLAIQPFLVAVIPNAKTINTYEDYNLMNNIKFHFGSEEMNDVIC